MKKYTYVIIIICLLYNANGIYNNYIEEYNNIIILEGHGVNEVSMDTLNLYSQDKEVAICILDYSLKNLHISYINEKYFLYEKYVILKGRVFIKEDRLNRKDYGMVNKEYAIKEFGTIDIIGKKININNREVEIIGIVGHQYIHNKVLGHTPMIYLGSWNNINIDDQYIRVIYDDENINPLKDIEQILMKIHVIKFKNLLRPLKNTITLFLKSIIIYLCIRMIICLRNSYKALKGNYIQTIKNMYITEWIYNNGKSMMKIVITMGMLCIGIYFNNRLKIEIDPNYIPNSLLSMNQIKMNIYQYLQSERQVPLYGSDIVYEIKALVHYFNIINLLNVFVLGRSLYKK